MKDNTALENSIPSFQIRHCDGKS